MNLRLPLSQDYLNSATTSNIPHSAIALSNKLQMAVSEAYINGLEIPDFLVLNTLKPLISLIYQHFSFLLVIDDWILQESEVLAENSKELMRVQYNLPTELFRLMLTENKLIYPKYTVALWEKEATTLIEAQQAMLDDVIQKAGITDGDEILDLGCGWGSASNYILSKFPNVRVTALNLSQTQCDYMRQKMQEPDSYLSSGRFTLIEEDFNTVQLANQFDRIIAIGLFEHIGNLTQAWQKIAKFLKKEGKVFYHIISFKLPHNGTSPFIDKYIFPRMRVWRYEEPFAPKRDLKVINHWYLNGYNYAKTLRFWLKNFDDHQTQLQNLDYGMEYQKFRRMWRLYLLWCIAYFEANEGKVLGNAQYLMEPV
ncbi:SAM-dependent methyltransferase [Aphanothece hegewaldii CCALA 016]|uniref:SAM-dependent methyltransferase n=1 Tax=Aphanothece hegewaldii CCALA 016 TaxID=2107694 RepID=A0A2T1M2S6_9CHRO|nr:class I SAM-dependent methyltransferase [Aphanothece hegewaldii]PSF39060.1 SAM-dependent methyltransferase [Aphanothece hegewaldii CCALA 016]